MIASTGKILAAIAIANTLRDTPPALYLDTKAPAQGLETCAKGGERHGRRALVAFACSLNDPLMAATAQVGQARMQPLIDRFGFNMPPTNAAGSGTPPSTAVVLGQVARLAAARAPDVGRRAGEPDRPRRNAGAGADAGQGLRLHQCRRAIADAGDDGKVTPNKIIRTGRPLLRTLGPAGARSATRPAAGRTGTLKDLRRWCAARATGREAALRQDRHVGDRGRRRHRRHLDHRRAAVRQRRRLLLRRPGRHRLAARAVGAQPARRAGGVPLLDALLTDLEAEATGRKRGPSPPAKAKTPASAAGAKKPAKVTAN